MPVIKDVTVTSDGRFIVVKTVAVVNVKLNINIRLGRENVVSPGALNPIADTDCNKENDIFVNEAETTIFSPPIINSNESATNDVKAVPATTIAGDV